MNYYNGICHKTTSESGTDISLKERKNEFVNNNMTVCEENCKFIDYDYINSKAKCRCEIKINLPLLDNITFDKKRLYDNFKDFKNIANLNLLKCYKQILTFQKLKKNYGFIICLFIITFLVFSLIIFSFIKFNVLKKRIREIYTAKRNIGKTNLLDQNKMT